MWSDGLFGGNVMDAGGGPDDVCGIVHMEMSISGGHLASRRVVITTEQSA